MNALKNTLLGTALVALGGLAGPALAKPLPSPHAGATAHAGAATPAAKPAAQPATATPAAEAAKPTHLMGTVVSASAKDRALTLKAADGEHALAVAPKAVFRSGAKSIGLGELHAGQKIDATVQKVNGKDTVESATITP